MAVTLLLHTMKQCSTWVPKFKIFYFHLQFIGAIFGAMTLVGLVPDAEFGSKSSPGCFAPLKELHRQELFGWELLLTFFFIMVLYASIFVKPGHGDTSPLAAGLALYACAATGQC